MSESNASPSSKPPRGSEIFWFAVTFLVAIGLFAAAFFLPVRGNFLPIGGNSALQEKMMDMERRVHTLEDRANALDARIENMPGATEQSSVRALSPNDLAHMQNDLAQLGSVVGNLQDQMKQNGMANHNLAQTALTKMVAFVQLRDAVASDHGFAHELEVMRAAAKDDPGLKEPLDKLTSYAEKGAPNIILLREQLTEQTSATEVATAKAAAQTWWERILAEFRGLVLIRPLHSDGAEEAGLEQVKTPLAHDDLDAALDAMKNLPLEAQQVLADWRKQAEARLAITDSMRAIADHLAAGGDTAPAPASTPVPAPAPDKDAP